MISAPTGYSLTPNSYIPAPERQDFSGNNWDENGVFFGGRQCLKHGKAEKTPKTDKQ